MGDGGLTPCYSYSQSKGLFAGISLEGAAIMNNTFCLGIFLALVYSIGLEWTFSAETISILFIEIVLCFFAFKKVQTMLDAWLVLALFPISVALVAILENAVGIN